MIGTEVVMMRWSENSQSKTEAVVASSEFVRMQSIEVWVCRVMRVGAFTKLERLRGRRMVWYRAL